MAELLLELYSEEIPPQLQIAARSQIKQFIENAFEKENIKYKELEVYSSPTRLTLFIKYLAEKIKTEAKEIKGPKVGSSHQVIQGFLRAKNVSEKDLIEKETDKGKFYFIKTQSQSILVEDLLIKIIPIMLLILTLLEIIGSVMLGYGVYYAFVNRSTLWIFYGFVVIAITIIILFAGQRIAKDYLGAADLVPYFILIMLGIMSMY